MYEGVAGGLLWELCIIYYCKIAGAIGDNYFHEFTQEIHVSKPKAFVNLLTYTVKKHECSGFAKILNFVTCFIHGQSLLLGDNPFNA